MATFKGKITEALPVVSGVSEKSGKEWRRASFIMEYDTASPQYPKSILFDVFGDKIDQLNLQQGLEYEVEVDFAVRAWKGRHFLSASAWKATPLAPVTPMAQAAPQQGWQAAYPQPQPTMPPQAPVQQPREFEGDPLPF